MHVRVMDPGTSCNNSRLWSSLCDTIAADNHLATMSTGCTPAINSHAPLHSRTLHCAAIIDLVNCNCNVMMINMNMKKKNIVS